MVDHTWGEAYGMARDVIAQAKKRARFWRTAFLMSTAALVLSNICWIIRYMR